MIIYLRFPKNMESRSGEGTECSGVLFKAFLALGVLELNFIIFDAIIKGTTEF